MYSEIANLVINLQEASSLILSLQHKNSELVAQSQQHIATIQSLENEQSKTMIELDVWKRRAERILRIDEQLEEKFQILSKEMKHVSMEEEEMKYRDSLVEEL